MASGWGRSERAAYFDDVGHWLCSAEARMVDEHMFAIPYNPKVKLAIGRWALSNELLATVRQAFREAAELEDSGARGGVTWERYVTAMQQYGEAILGEGGWLAPTGSERLDSALARAEAALKPPR